MRGLFDVSVLLALHDADHLHHARATAWWDREAQRGWASCPLSQNGFARIISQRSYSRPLPLVAALDMLRATTARPDHEFWPDDLSILDPAHIDHTHLLGPRQLTDIYLLALAVKHGGRFVTLDTSIALAAVRGAVPSQLVIV
jgi:uncharacterized protein